MKKQILLSLLVAGFMLPACAQTKLELAKLTDAQKFETLAFNNTAVHAGSIAYIKSMGKTPKEYGQAIGKLFGSSWAQTKASGKELEGVVEHMNSVTQAYLCPFELTNWSAKEAVIKRGMLLQDPKVSNLYASMGVTAQDMEAWYEGVMGEIATGLGLSLSQRQEGQNIIITVKKL